MFRPGGPRFPMEASEDDPRWGWFRREILPLESELKAYAVRFCRSGSAEAEDLIHESFARAIAYANWRSIDNPAGFVKRVMKNVALDTARG